MNEKLTLIFDKLAIKSSSSLVAVEAAGTWVAVTCDDTSSVSPGYPVSVLVSFTVITTFLGPV